MDISSIESQVVDSLKEAKAFFEAEISKLRTGRAYPGILDQLMVDVYETKMPVQQLATISVPSANSLQVTPFDAKNLEAIIAAIQADQQLNLNPTDNGRDIYVTMPPLTTERRTQLIKSLHQKKEEAYIRFRQVRHKALKTVKEADFAESETHRFESKVDELMQKQRAEIEAMSQQKEKDIATV